MATRELTLPPRVRPAVVEDAATLLSLINDSYDLTEAGVRAPCFKLTQRFLDERELLPLIERGELLVAIDAAGIILGAIASACATDEGVTRTHFGPFAVSASAQGMGVGTRLLAAVEERARAAGCASVDCEVVNHRCDLLPFYLTRGWRVVGEGAFPAPERCSRPSHFILLRRALAGAEPAFL